MYQSLFKFKEIKIAFVFLLIASTIKSSEMNKQNRIIAKYKIDSEQSDKILLFNRYLLSYISSMTLNGEDIDISYTYKFEEEGEHEIIINLSKDLERADELFIDCLFLKEIDFTETKFSNIPSLKGLFRNCKGLEKVEFGDIDTSNVKDMNGVFSSCVSLVSVDLSAFNTKNVQIMIIFFFV